MLYMVTFTINIPPMLAYIPYMDPMGTGIYWYLKKCLLRQKAFILKESQGADVVRNMAHEKSKVLGSVFDGEMWVCLKMVSTPLYPMVLLIMKSL